METELHVNGRRIKLHADPEQDASGQFHVWVTVDGALTGDDVHVWGAYFTDRSEDDAVG